MSNLEQEIMTLISNSFSLKLYPIPNGCTIELVHTTVSDTAVFYSIPFLMSPDTLAYKLREAREHLNQTNRKNILNYDT